ncbi:VOC family protein [Streptomyces iconiensis]|uniref:VOC family protein n=1 Tax=Streptomyces iconiensis TaxID=1384038 RepID=A0ABT6ZXV9_9ACTN|nr:VOC family protein [Streptomyces iconiensis]MDJ1133909.1 VOC family protein [Streptomyces iconiensis]
MPETPPIPARLTVVTLGARDLPRLRAFYLALGWPELPASDDGWAAFPLGGAMLALYPLDELAREAAPGAPPPAGWSGVTLACNVETAAQVDAAYTAALAAGATSVEAPKDREWGGRSAYLTDPEGNRWEFAWARNAVFDARGAVTSLG